MHAYRFSVAPMMERTDRHFRVLARAVSRRCLLYTEMVMGRAILNGRAERDLGFDASELPLALQVGDNDPRRLVQCARVAQERGFTELNLNCGCPSSAVRDGAFGARLMMEPQRVADAVAAMKGATSLPVTIKHRIGVDELDRYEDMLRFVDIVTEAGCDGFIVHARKAWLHGLSPKENRNVPPLRPEDIHRLKRERPSLRIELNGGVDSSDAVLAALTHADPVDGVMVGRAIYRDPLAFADVDARVYGDTHPVATLEEVLETMVQHTRRWVDTGGRVHDVSRHVHGLFLGRRGGRKARRVLAEAGAGADLGTLQRAVASLTEARTP
ncbi:MAG: tRNA dihydrouridine(20/20a) synthase DusA [Nannocystales bacterium]